MNRLRSCCSLATLAFLVAAGPALAAPPVTTTVDLVYSHGALSNGLPSADAVDLRGTWQIDGGDVATAELLDERKFDARGGIAALGYTRVISREWLATLTVAAGHGGANWANLRADAEVARKWGTDGSLVTRLAVYHAGFDGQRSDRGLRLGAAAYLAGGLVVEGGVIANVSDPGAVRSNMPFVAATTGRDGEQYLSLRLSSGSEGYQAVGAGQQLVGFHSSSAGLSWKRWLPPVAGTPWGLNAQAEWYRNPSYRRLTAGGGVFVQF